MLPTPRQLSRHLVGLWVTGNPTANALLHRILVLHHHIHIVHTCTYILYTAKHTQLVIDFSGKCMFEMCNAKLVIANFGMLTSSFAGVVAIIWLCSWLEP